MLVPLGARGAPFVVKPCLDTSEAHLRDALGEQVPFALALASARATYSAAKLTREVELHRHPSRALRSKHIHGGGDWASPRWGSTFRRTLTAGHVARFPGWPPRQHTRPCITTKSCLQKSPPRGSSSEMMIGSFNGGWHIVVSAVLLGWRTESVSRSNAVFDPLNGWSHGGTPISGSDRGDFVKIAGPPRWRTSHRLRPPPRQRSPRR
jgi:hypothetical protein